MLAKCVLGSGIKNKQAIKITEHNNYEIYYLKEWGEDGLKFIMYDNYLFLVGFDIERVKQSLDHIIDIKQALIAEFEQTLRQGRGISAGLGQYLNRTENVIKFKEEQKQKRIEEEKQREIEKKERKQREVEEIEKMLSEKAERFKNGHLISNEHFVMLCDKYNIKLPLRTRGWCLKTLVYISKDNYKYKKRWQ